MILWSLKGIETFGIPAPVSFIVTRTIKERSDKKSSDGFGRRIKGLPYSLSSGGPAEPETTLREISIFPCSGVICNELAIKLRSTIPIFCLSIITTSGFEVSSISSTYLIVTLVLVAYDGNLYEDLIESKYLIIKRVHKLAHKRFESHS